MNIKIGIISISSGLLTDDSKQRILTFKPTFSQEASDTSERREHMRKIANLLQAENLANFNEATFIQLMSTLWANQWWSNKDYLIQRVLSSTPIENLRKELKFLLWGDRPIAERYERFRENVKHMGPSQMTEILNSINQKDYAIWNERVRNALEVLNITDVIPLKHYITGKDYEKFCLLAKEIAQVIRDNKLTDPDLLDVDYFLYHVQENFKTTKQLGLEKEVKEFDHQEVKEMLVRLGQGLGFDAEEEVPIATGSRVDVVWKAKIGNLGEIKYVFEVQRGGSIDSLIVNLLRARSDPAVQKVIAVSTKDYLEKIQGEAKNLPTLMDRFVLWEITDVNHAVELMDNLNEIMRKLELVKI
jgi:hypothetical protein